MGDAMVEDSAASGGGRYGSPRRDVLAVAGVTTGVLFVCAHGLDAWVRSTGPTASATASFLLTMGSLAAGVGLTTVGALVASRRRLGWWRLLAVPAIAVGLFWSAVPAVMAWVSTHSGTPSSGQAGVEIPGLEDVAIPSPGGVMLGASYVAGTNGATVVCLPGAGSARRAVVPHARVLASHGYGVVLVDPRGHGASSGDAMEYGWHGETDVRAVTDWLARQPGVDPGRIGVLGLSMGGEQALTAARSDARLAAVVAEGATARSYEDVRRTLGGLSVVVGVPQYRALFGLADLLSDASEPAPLEDAIREAQPRPTLLITTASEASYGRRYAAIPGEVELWAPASEQHIGALAENPDEWEQRVVGLLDAALAP